jgi:hypothetical protein
MVLVLGMRKVVKLCCCCSKNHVLLYWINAFEILAYLSEIHEVVFELCQMHVLSSFYDLGYEIKWEIHEVVVLISCFDWIVVSFMRKWWYPWKLLFKYELSFMIWIGEVLLWWNEENYVDKVHECRRNLGL